MNAHPVRAVGMGGRQVRTSPAFGMIFDHFAVDYEYPSGAHAMSMCRQIEGCENNVSESVVGTKGRWESSNYKITGSDPWNFRGKSRNPYEQEHVDMIESNPLGQAAQTNCRPSRRAP